MALKGEIATSSGATDADDLRQVKELLILLLLKLGATSDEIALVKGIGASTVRRDFPARQVRKLEASASHSVRPE